MALPLGQIPGRFIIQTPGILRGFINDDNENN